MIISGSANLEVGIAKYCLTPPPLITSMDFDKNRNILVLPFLIRVFSGLGFKSKHHQWNLVQSRFSLAIIYRRVQV